MKYAREIKSRRIEVTNSCTTYNANNKKLKILNWIKEKIKQISRK